MLYCLFDRLDRGVDVCEFLLCLYANSEPHKTSVPTLQVSLFPFIFIYYPSMASFNSNRCTKLSRLFLFYIILILFVFLCSSDCENTRGKELCSYPQANLSLSTGERVSIFFCWLHKF